MTPQTERKRSTFGFALVITVAVVSMLMLSRVIDRLAPPGEPLLYTAGAGLVVGLLIAAVASVVRRRNR